MSNTETFTPITPIHTVGRKAFYQYVGTLAVGTFIGTLAGRVAFEGTDTAPVKVALGNALSAATVMVLFEEVSHHLDARGSMIKSGVPEVLQNPVNTTLLFAGVGLLGCAWHKLFA